MYSAKYLVYQSYLGFFVRQLTAMISESLIMASTRATESTILIFVFDWNP
jgi:hypothetical protein